MYFNDLHVPGKIKIDRIHWGMRTVQLNKCYPSQSRLQNVGDRPKNDFVPKHLGNNSEKLNKCHLIAPRETSNLDCKARFSVYWSICHCLIFTISIMNSANPFWWMDMYRRNLLSIGVIIRFIYVISPSISIPFYCLPTILLYLLLGKLWCMGVRTPFFPPFVV